MTKEDIILRDKAYKFITGQHLTLGISYNEFQNTEISLSVTEAFQFWDSEALEEHIYELAEGMFKILKEVANAHKTVSAPETTAIESVDIVQQLNDNIDRPDRHNINPMNRPPRSIDPMSPRNLDHSGRLQDDPAIDHVLAERGLRYGDFKERAAICQDLKDIMRNTPSWNACSPTQRQALEVIADKVARMLNGDPNYDDNWVDIIGYSQLVLREL